QTQCHEIGDVEVVSNRCAVSPYRERFAPTDFAEASRHNAESGALMLAGSVDVGWPKNSCTATVLVAPRADEMLCRDLAGAMIRARRNEGALCGQLDRLGGIETATGRKVKQIRLRKLLQRLHKPQGGTQVVLQFRDSFARRVAWRGPRRGVNH